MLTLLCLIAVVVLIALHEYIAIRTPTAGFNGSIARRMALLGLVGFAIAFGARAELSARFRSALDSWTAKPDGYELIGDPFLRGALESQRPERPYPIGTPADDVMSWQARVRETLRVRSGFPPGVPPTVSFRRLASEDIGDIRRILLEFTSWDGTRIPAYLHQPTRATHAAGVLVIPGHSEGIRATAGVGAPDYQHAAALELAKRGYVTLTAELRGFGLLGSNGRPLHDVVAHAALEAGSFYKAIVARDLQFALSILQRWDGVDPSRLAVVGTSLGGELAVFFGALDPRAQVIISHSYGGRVGPISVVDPSTKRAPHGCHTIPGVNLILYQEDWFRLLAPRAVQVARGTDNRPRDSTLKSFRAATADTFERLGAPDRFEISVERGEHEFFVEAAARFLSRWL